MERMPRISKTAFDSAAEYTRLHRHTTDMARAVLVRGAKAHAVAAEYGVPPKVVYRACAAVRHHLWRGAHPDVVESRLERIEAALARIEAALVGG